jgi:hypothetical protein
MTTFHNKPRARAAGKTLAALALLTAGGIAGSRPLRAADPYDQSLETRVEALEKELNIMEGDSKGKNVESETVPTFASASPNVQQLTLSAELRFRYEGDDISGQTIKADEQADRLRYRLRLFADYKLNDNFFAGVAVQNAAAADSGNTTFSEGFDNYALYLWRFFVGWQSSDKNIKIVAGKMANPFYYETELFWDADISPTGLTETWKLPISPEFDITFIGGQFIYYDNPENAYYNNPQFLANGTKNPNYVPGATNNVDAYLLDQQVVATFKPSNDLSITGAAGFFFYPGHGGLGGATTVNPGVGPGGAAVVSPGGGTLGNTAAFNSANATRNLDVATGSGDVKLSFGTVKVKPYGEVAYNFKGGARDSQEYGLPFNHSLNDKFAFATGFTVGSNYTLQNKGDYLFLAEYRQVGLGSIDPNLNDSDFNLSRLGFRGIKIAGSYAFYPWLIGTVTFYGAENLGVDKNVNIGVGDFNGSKIIQVDLTTKF